MSSLIVSNLSDGTLSIPTTYVTNGSAKAWVNFNGTGTIAIRDSLNVASLTDDGTALYTVNYSSALANSDYCLLGSNKYTGSGTGLSFVLRNVTTPLTASSSQVFCAPDFSVSATDNPIVMLDVKGDLA